MTTKEKAKELYEKFFYTVPSISDEGQLEDKISKQCALIAVDEVLKTFPNINGIAVYEDHVVDIDYWQEVKQEIEKL